MNQSKHSPGPWSTTKIGAQVRDGAKRVIAFIAHYGMSAEERAANARLIAAAPRMLAALERIAEWRFNLDGDCVAEAQELARAIIAEAREVRR